MKEKQFKKKTPVTSLNQSLSLEKMKLKILHLHFRPCLIMPYKSEPQ